MSVSILAITMYMNILNLVEKITHDFSLLDWSPIDDPSVSVNDHFDYFLEKSTTFIDSHLPKKKTTENPLN